MEPGAAGEVRVRTQNAVVDLVRDAATANGVSLLCVWESRAVNRDGTARSGLVAVFAAPEADVAIKKQCDSAMALGYLSQHPAEIMDLPNMFAHLTNQGVSVVGREVGDHLRELSSGNPNTCLLYTSPSPRDS
eukprot:TRINITY_DN33296_c0_g1_i1.p1 TRINITY_DN33296_c0_g1~~TRINITY_DN33296_c0_g1_i1.p1  ORF type:complete len:133 (-),score=37.17 TRINITY_DN33296_c0_g1_i1:87-485(-)